jgi:hypothetical protein
VVIIERQCRIGLGQRQPVSICAAVRIFAVIDSGDRYIGHGDARSARLDQS